LFKKCKDFLIIYIIAILITMVGMVNICSASVRDRNNDSTSIYTEKTVENMKKIEEGTTTYRQGADPVPVEDESQGSEGTSSRNKGWGCIGFILKIILLIIFVYILIQCLQMYRRWRWEKEYRNF
jgi:uncharacterized membrane protein